VLTIIMPSYLIRDIKKWLVNSNWGRKYIFMLLRDFRKQI